MTTTLTPAQRAWLESLLKGRQRELDQRLATQLDGQTRVEHSREVLTGDSDPLGEREGARQLDMILSDREMQEVGQVAQALRRLHDADFGRCEDCGQDIPFDRLKVEPWALRCVACEAARERGGMRR